MTTTLAKTDPPTDRPLSHRIPSVTANLLPVEVMEARRSRRVKRMVVVLLAVFVVLLVGWYGYARVQTELARSELADAKASTERLTKQQDAFAELQQVQRDSAAIQAQLAQLMASDMAWATLMRDLRRAAPANLRLTGITVTLDASRTVGTAANTTGASRVAFVTITGIGTSKPQIAAYVDALSKVNGVADPFITSVSASEKGLDFDVKVDVTQALLGGRYTTPSKEPK
jgi:Tfp pilus assembly protein PilN